MTVEEHLARIIGDLVMTIARLSAAADATPGDPPVVKGRKPRQKKEPQP